MTDNNKEAKLNELLDLSVEEIKILKAIAKEKIKEINEIKLKLEFEELNKDFKEKQKEQNKYSATEILKRRKEIPKRDCRTCKHFYKENNTEICFKVDKFIVPIFRPQNCMDWEE